MTDTYKTLEQAVKSVRPDTSDRQIDDYANEYADTGQVVITDRDHVVTIGGGFGNVYHVDTDLKE